MAEIRWLTDPSSARRTVEGSADTVVGEWYSGTSSIVLTREYLNDPGVVRHEMLHALLRNAGHPAATFRDACGGYVVCGGSCAGAVGATPASTVTARKVEVDSLAVTQSIRSGLGWFALVVEARNARSYPVWVRLQPFPGRTDVAATFGYASGQNSHQNEITGDSMSFAPGETKRFVFDLMADQYVVDNGSRKIRGFFNAVKLPELIVP
ncbi:MAG: hypothetical protein ABIY52_13915 [Gemmatimonadaceae bacterium]